MDVRHGLAIPHIVVEENAPFDVLIARCVPGINFAEGVSPVHAVIVLVGSRAERNIHLRFLAAVARVVQSPDFYRNWLSATSSSSGNAASEIADSIRRSLGGPIVAGRPLLTAGLFTIRKKWARKKLSRGRHSETDRGMESTASYAPSQSVLSQMAHYPA